MNASTAIQQLRRIVAPRELTIEQRKACIAARAHLLALHCMARDFNDAAAPLIEQRLIAPVSLATVRLRLQNIEQLLADDRKARAA